MLQNQLQKIKGQFLEMMFEQYRDMNTSEDGIDYGEFYEELFPTIVAIKNITTIGNLEEFCEEYGMNDIDNEMSFPSLVKKAYS